MCSTKNILQIFPASNLWIFSKILYFTMQFLNFFSKNDFPKKLFLILWVLFIYLYFYELASLIWYCNLGKELQAAKVKELLIDGNSIGQATTKVKLTQPRHIISRAILTIFSKVLLTTNYKHWYFKQSA